MGQTVPTYAEFMKRLEKLINSEEYSNGSQIQRYEMVLDAEIWLDAMSLNEYDFADFLKAGQDSPRGSVIVCTSQGDHEILLWGPEELVREEPLAQLVAILEEILTEVRGLRHDMGKGYPSSRQPDIKIPADSIEILADSEPNKRPRWPIEPRRCKCDD